MLVANAGVLVAAPHAPQRPGVGVAYGLGAYAWWGFVLPWYFKALDSAPALELLAHRVIFGLPVLLGIVWFLRGWGRLREACTRWRSLRLLVPTAALIGVNWFVFIYAVVQGRLLEASLGYFINPLVSIALGFFFLGERPRPVQWAAIVLAAASVAGLTIAHGSLPWVSVTVALSFGLYGLLRKRAEVDSVTGVTVETVLLLPFMLALQVWLYLRSEAVLGVGPHWQSLLMTLGGAMTVVPLVWFTTAARRLRLATMGLMQYIAPTGQFLTAVLAFGEPFDRTRAVAFGVIWVALGLYTWDSWRGRTRRAVAAPVPTDGLAAPSVAPWDGGGR